MCLVNISSLEVNLKPVHALYRIYSHEVHLSAWDAVRAQIPNEHVCPKGHEHDSTTSQTLDLPIRCIIVTSLLLAFQVRIEELEDRFALIRKSALSAVTESIVGVPVEMPFRSFQSQLRALDYAYTIASGQIIS